MSGRRRVVRLKDTSSVCQGESHVSGVMSHVRSNVMILNPPHPDLVMYLVM